MGWCLEEEDGGDCTIWADDTGQFNVVGVDEVLMQKVMVDLVTQERHVQQNKKGIIHAGSLDRACTSHKRALVKCQTGSTSAQVPLNAYVFVRPRLANQRCFWSL